MKNFAKVIAGLAAMVCVSQANASFMIEPFIGYQMGDYDDGSTEEDLTGIEFGARLGYSVTMFSFGAEYAKGDVTVDSSPKVDVSTTNLGAFVAVDFPILLRAYATYIFKAEAKADTSGAEKLVGTGSRIGVGYTGLPFVSINFELLNATYDETSSGASLATDTKVSAKMISVSVPLP